MENLLFDPSTLSPSNGNIGGKGRNLLLLQQEHPVPEWVGVPVEYFFKVMEANGVQEKIGTLLQSFESSQAATLAAGIQKLILQMPMPDNLLQAIATIPFLDNAVSVRSSAADEDGVRYSFAGIHESFLYVRGVESIAAHIRKVWASGYQERALLYRHERNLPLHPVPMAVLIQRMIDARASGVVFTADPAGDNPLKVIVSALYGLGEGLVSAGLPADMFRCDKRTSTIESDIVEKKTQYLIDPQSCEGLSEQPVDTPLQRQASLTEAQVRQVVETALVIEKRARRPQDIEFCLDADGRLFILQTRDITTITDFGPAAGHRLAWDNANIIESYSGVTTPMTFSFIRYAYTVVYHCFSQVMGIPASVVKANRPVFENMLGLIRGQVYYNLINWYLLIQQFPGYSLNKRFMESMMGLREQFDPEDDKPTSWWRKWFIEIPRLGWLLLRMLTQFATIDWRVDNFQKRFHTLYRRWEALDFDALTPHARMDVYREMESRLLWHWQAPIINDFYVMIHYGLLRTLCKKWCGDTTQSLQNDLICGNGDIESTEPTRMLMRLARQIRQDPALLRIFETHTHHELAQTVPNDPACARVATEIKIYLQKYGFRCINELKLEEPSLRETPEFVYQILQNYLHLDPAMLDTDAMAAREDGIRQQAEQKADAAMLALPLYWARRIIFYHILNGARKGVRNRENMRFARTRIYGVLRELIQSMGRDFVRNGILDQTGDIFYLTIDEVWDFVKGTAVTTDLRGLTALRQREFEQFRTAATPADHFDSYGMVYLGNAFQNHRDVTPAEGDLSGIGCCPGEVTAPVRIVRSPRDDLDLNGCILVAERTDPGWIPLYPAVCGILIERGSILSHSAIVAREMGIPAIVGIQGLLATLQDGQTVTMNGKTGIVSIDASMQQGGPAISTEH
jgi:rifampicin phosphotransferase